MKTLVLTFACSLALPVFAVESSVTPEVQKQLRGIAQTYLKGQLVNPMPKIAPTQCFLPPTQVLFSQAKPGKAHGGKLFYLFAKKRAPLAHKEKIKAQPVGQYLVKESWLAVEPTGEPSGKQAKHASGQYVSGRTFHKEKTLVIGDPLDLYIMLKLDPKTANTDEGWIYAVLDRDGETVHHAGRLQSCIDCHEDAKHDRILGDYASPHSNRLE